MECSARKPQATWSDYRRTKYAMAGNAAHPISTYELACGTKSLVAPPPSTARKESEGMGHKEPQPPPKDWKPPTHFSPPPPPKRKTYDAASAAGNIINKQSATIAAQAAEIERLQDVMCSLVAYAVSNMQTQEQVAEMHARLAALLAKETKEGG